MNVAYVRFDLDKGFSCRELARLLSECSFDSDSESGFSVSKVNSVMVAGRFSYRRTKSIQIHNADGESDSISGETVETCEFAILYSERMLVLSNPTCGLRRFISRVGEVTLFRVTLEKIEFRFAALNRLDSGDRESFSVSRVYLTKVDFGKDVTGSLVASGRIHEAALNGTIRQLSGAVNKVSVKWWSPTLKLPLEATFSRNGRVLFLTEADFRSATALAKELRPLTE